LVAYVVPPEKKESYTLTGAGSYSLTEEQRSARTLTVLAELVLLSPPPRYFNFIYPEPQSFWGYVQWMMRDYELNTKQLEYRRQVLYTSDFVDGERNRQLLCLLGISQELAYLKLLDLLALLDVPVEDRAVFFENWKDETDVKFLTQVRPETALWYEVVPGFAMQLTVIWVPHWEACKPGQVPVFLPPPRGTNKDEQRPNDGGGGQQPSTPPPPGRRSDPLSDSPAPPPSNSTGPSSPTPAQPPPGPNQRFRFIAKPSPSELPTSGTGYGPITYTTFVSPGGAFSGMQVFYRAVPGGPALSVSTGGVPTASYAPSLIVTPI
jgi:hypothetical protein